MRERRERVGERDGEGKGEAFNRIWNGRRPQFSLLRRSVRPPDRDAAFFVTFFSSTEEKKKSSHRSPPPPIVFQEYKTKKKRTAMMKTPSFLPNGREVQVRKCSVRPFGLFTNTPLQKYKQISKRDDRRTTPLNSYAERRDENEAGRPEGKEP